MTEEQKLKQQTKKQLVDERLEEISEYLDMRLAESKKAMKWFTISVFAQLTIVIVSVVFPSRNMNFLFSLSLLATWAFFYPEVVRADSKFVGCIHTLRILGILSDHDFRTRRKIKKISWYERMWQATKNTLRKKPYGTVETV